MRFFTLASAVAVLCLLGSPSQAASLRVAPIQLDLPSGTAATMVRVWNNDPATDFCSMETALTLPIRARPTK